MQVSTHSKSTPAFRSVLVLCEGNHCRSPIAAALLRASLDAEIKVESAGLNALVDYSPDPEAQQLMADIGIDISNYRGRQLTTAMVLAADLILVMDQRQKNCCEELVPSARGRVFLLGHWLPSPPREISDPFRQGPAAYRSVFKIINHSVASWLPCMVNNLRSA